MKQWKLQPWRGVLEPMKAVSVMLPALAISLFAGCAMGPKRVNPQQQDSSAPAPTSTEAPHAERHSFGLYLVTDNEDGPISQVTLSEHPVISEADIISYIWTNHAMKVTPEAWDRVPQPGLQGLPFVVVADGERVYIGVFWTRFSSSLPSRPSIDVLPGHSQHPVTLYIEPSRSRRLDPDPRCDLRIKGTLTALGKLQ